MTVPRLLAAACLWLLTSTLAFGQPTTPGPTGASARLDATMQRLGTAFVQESPHVGLSVGIIRNGQTHFYNFGTTQKGQHQLPTPRTRYEIASISKTFAGLLLAQAATEKRVRLTDDIRNYLPGEYANLTFEGKPIQLVHLVNTTSGLPDNVPEWTAAFQAPLSDSTFFRAIRGVRHYTKQEFYRYLHTVRLTAAPGRAPQHSNVAAQLLGYLLEDLYQMPYEQLLQQNIAGPLQLENSLAPGAEHSPMATGYNDQGTPMPLFNLPNMQADAGLTYGTADMLKYLAYQLAEQSAAVRLSHQPGWGSLDEQAIAFNWNGSRTVDGQRRLHASGGSFGFASHCELYPDKKLGIVLLSNESDPGTQSRLQEIAQELVVALYGIPPALQALKTGLLAQNFKGVFGLYNTVKKQHPELHLTEEHLNSWGYDLLRAGKSDHALELFKLNVQLHPASWNPYDSLAETYESLGNKQLAIENYRRSVALNPQNANGIEHLRQLNHR